MDYRQLVRQEAEARGLDPNLAEAVLLRESGGNPNAVSKVGARGLMQLMPGTAAELGVDPNDPVQNAKGGVQYLAQQVSKFGPAGGVAAYNAGPGGLMKAKGDFSALPAETRAYVPAVLNTAASLAEGGSGKPAQASQPSIDQVINALGKAKAANDQAAVQEISGLLKQKFDGARQKALDARDAAAVQEIDAKWGEITGSKVTGVQSDIQPQAPQQPQAARKLEESTAAKDPQWVQNAKTLYQQFEKKPFKGTDEQASQWLLEKMSWYNNNIASLGKSAMDVSNFSDEGKKAFLDTVKDYDAMPTTLNAVGRGLVANLADPTNYLGLGAGAIATKTVGKTAAKEAAQQVIKDALEKNLGKRVASSLTGQTAKVAAGGAAYNAGQNALEQQALVNAGGQDGIDLTKVAGSGALGATGGAAISKVVNKIAGRDALSKFVKDAGDEAGLKTKAEIASDLAKVADNPNMQGQPLQAIHANALEQKYVNDVQSVLKNIGRADLEKMGADPKDLQKALMDRKIITPDQLDKIRGNAAGDALADAIEKAQRTRSMTQAVNASTGAIPTMARAVSGWVLPERIASGVQRVFGSRQTREQRIADVLKAQKTAETILDPQVLGKSDATKSANALGNIAKQAQTAATARQAAQQSTKDAAQNAGEQLRIRNLQMGIRSNPKFIQGDIGGGTRGTLQYYGRVADSKELAKGLKIIEKTDPYLAPYIDRIKQNKTVPNKDILLGLSDRLLKLRDDGILKPYIK